MAIKGFTTLTLADWAKRKDPDGKVSTIVELLSQTNPILEDMVFVEANGETSHTTTIRTGLPAAAWRKFNAGVQSSKSTTAQLRSTIGMLEAYAEVDKSLADLNGNTTEFRLSEDRAFLESINQAMAYAVFYGDTDKYITTANTEEGDIKLKSPIDGLSSYYKEKTANSGQNIIDAGGSGEHLSSIWLVVWSSNTVHGIFPRGQQAGLKHRDLGEQTLRDANGGMYQGYRTHYKWDCGMSLRDWRYAVRIANIDTSKLGGDKGPNIANLMVRALHRIPNLQMGKPAFYMNRDLAEYLDIQATEKSSLAISVRETEGVFWTSFRGVPVRTCDALESHEEKVV